jgi:general secretion pathway protein C
MSATAWIQELPSFAATREHALAQGPRLVAGLLLALIAVQLALTLTRQSGGSTAASGAGATALPRPATVREIDLAALVNAHLFGQKAAIPVSASDAPQSTMPLVLAGVYAVSDPKRGMAIVGQTATNARLVQVGGNIAGGARLHSVYSDRVLIDRGGALEAVYLPKNLASTGAPPVSVAPAASAGQRLQNLAQNGTLLNGLLRVQAVTAQGKLMGYRVFPGGRNSLAVFGQLGLRAGDLITNINGTALDDVNRSAEILQTLSNASSASVTVSRNGQPTEVNLNLTAVAQAAEEAVAADAAAAATAGANPGAGPRGGFAPGAGFDRGAGGQTGANGGGGRPGGRSRGGNGTNGVNNARNGD